MPVVRIQKRVPVEQHRLVIDFPHMTELKGSVRFNPFDRREAAVTALYVTREGWDALGRPERVRLTLERLD